jgi:hypothetical protein
MATQIWQKELNIWGSVEIHRKPGGATTELVVTAYDKPLEPTPPGPSECYVDVPFTIGGHTETYRVHARYNSAEIMELVSVEELP